MLGASSLYLIHLFIQLRVFISLLNDVRNIKKFLINNINTIHVFISSFCAQSSFTVNVTFYVQGMTPKKVSPLNSHIVVYFLFDISMFFAVYTTSCPTPRIK